MPEAHTIDADTEQFPPGEPTVFRFRVRNPKGGLLSDFAVTHPGHVMSALAQRNITGGGQHAAAHVLLGDPQLMCELPGGYRVHIANPVPFKSNTDAAIQFVIELAGQPVIDLENYLGANGHTVILSAGTLNFIHSYPLEAAPSDSNVVFHTHLPEPCNYKVFAKFQQRGLVLTAPFVVKVR